MVAIGPLRLLGTTKIVNYILQVGKFAAGILQSPSSKLRCSWIEKKAVNHLIKLIEIWNGKVLTEI